MTPKHDPQLVLSAPELRHLAVLLEMLGASEQDLLVECGTKGYQDRSPSQLAAFDLIAAIRTLRAVISCYRRSRLRALRSPRSNRLDDEYF
jgi:hypothetical protein